jgi:hypothetical protein
MNGVSRLVSGMERSLSSCQRKDGRYLLRILTDMLWLGKNPKYEDLEMFMPWSVEIQSACVAPKAKSPSGDLW